MADIRWILLLTSAALILILVRALLAGNIHSNYSVTYRRENPGTFWALWIVLLLPLVAVLFLALKLHPAARH
jgi:FtsH-binding integral membrane protein